MTRQELSKKYPELVGVPMRRHKNGGGWVAKTARVNKSAYVEENAVVCGCATVHKEARIFDEAMVSGFAMIYNGASIYDNAQVKDRAIVGQNATIQDEVIIKGNALIEEGVVIQGDAKISGNAFIGKRAQLAGNAVATKPDSVIIIGPIGSRMDNTTYAMESDTIICGCFIGTLDEFEERVKKRHRNNKYAKQYMAMIAMLRVLRTTMR